MFMRRRMLVAALLVMLLLGGCGSPVPEPVAFQNPLIEDALRKELNQPEGALYADDLLLVTSFYYRHGDILEPLPPFDLQDLELLKNLSEVHIERVHVEHIEALSSLHQLTALSLQHCAFDNMPSFDALTQIEEISLNYSVIADLESVTVELKKARRLKELHMTHSDISDISFLADMEHLERFSAFRSAVNDAAVFRSTPNLKELDLRSTGITDFSPLYELQHLEYLRVLRTPTANLAELGDAEAIARLEQLREALPECYIVA